METLRHKLAFWGLMGRTGNPLAKEKVRHMLTNVTYIGLLKHNGETHEGKFEAIVDKATFEQVQEEMSKRSKPRKHKNGHNFPFTGLLTCAECGGAITAQYAKQRQYI